MTDDENTPFQMRQIDLSQFHAIGDHLPFTSYCRSQYKGGWHHLKLAWTYHRKEQLTDFFLRPFYRAFLCPRNTHRGAVWHNSGTDNYSFWCHYCRYRRSSTEEEWRRPSPKR